MQHPHPALFHRFFSSQQQRPAQHKKARHTYSCKSIQYKRKCILSRTDFSKCSAIIICHMNHNHQYKRNGSDQFQIIVLLFHRLLLRFLHQTCFFYRIFSKTFSNLFHCRIELFMFFIRFFRKLNVKNTKLLRF